MQADQISSTIAGPRKIDRNFIKSVISGEANPDQVKTYEQYSNLYKIRHDAIHWLICQHREVPFGEKQISTFEFAKEICEHKYYHLIKNQTPDILQVKGRTINITELTISRMKIAEIPKITKYRTLVSVLESYNYTVNLEIIVINCMFPIPDRQFLKSQYGFSHDLIDQIYEIIRNVDSLLHRVNDTDQGAEWVAKFRGLTLEEVDFNLTDDDVIKFHNTVERKTFLDEEDLKNVLSADLETKITDDDNAFIDYLTSEAIKIKSPLEKTQDAVKAVEAVRKHHQENSNVKGTSYRSFFPLPYVEQLEVDSADRHTHDDEKITAMAFGAFNSSQDPFFVAIRGESGTFFKPKLPPDVKYQMALQGPGRKTYVNRGSIEHIQAQNNNRAKWYPVGGDFTTDISDLANAFSKIDSFNDYDPVGQGMNYVKVCQSIFRELNINAMRGNRTKQYCLKPTGVKGLLILIYPGAKLRTGENISIVWFKVIVLHDFWKKTPLSNSWMFKKLNQDINFSHSDWLSTDANRLDHYIRCYDKILMAYACYSSFSQRKLREEMRYSNSNTLGTIIMIYMEDKRSTSKMLQDVRYLVMSMLSMHIYYEDILKKFKDPIRTPLQSYLLEKILNFSLNDQVRQTILASKFGKLNVEIGSGDPFDKTAGAQIMIPRILTDGPMIDFRQMLCEMYFCMLFNKNQDDPTHASFQILSKILEGEASLNEVKQTTGLHMGKRNGDFEDLRTLLENPHKNQFSRRAIIIASKLQAKSSSNKASNGVAHKLASTSTNINKYLDEFATFKSSSTVQNLVYNPEVYTTAKIDNEDMDKNDVKKRLSGERNVQNRRRRCLEGVQELIDQGYLRSFDLIKDKLMQPFYFQIFKKNQIGGVREILILDINKRVLTNILESFSRVICHDDEREMLTHGDKKTSLMRDILRDLKRGDKKKIIMNYNFDKTKWAPSFMPIQFLYMFLPFRKMYPSLFRFICISLINHSNKKFLLPEKLLRAWRCDLSNEKHHEMDDNLQALKEEFLRTKSLAYTNESNMGQGILHYTSSYYHLCFISLRDEVYVRLCKKINIDPGEWRDMVSSDDSYTAHALPMDTATKARHRIILFLRAQEIVERVMNVWTSTSKSSISILVGEFNSLFGSNLTMFPTTFKFALASVHPVNTDSFFRMVKESYIASRQIVENGGSLELYTIASKLNKRYCESIYHTGAAAQNDLNQFGIRPEYAPYQLGVYPIMDPAIMLMFGPECQNYNILNNLDKTNDIERKIFNIMHTLVDVEDPALFAAMNSHDDILVGVNRIEAHIGPIGTLKRIRENIPMSFDQIRDIIISNPLLLLTDPKTKEELQAKVYIKLYQKGAAEALRTTAASLYYARVAASVSAKAFTIPMVTQEKRTFKGCVELLLSLDERPLELSTLYPYMNEYKNVLKLSHIDFQYDPRDVLETQNIRTLELNALHQRIHNPIVKLLKHFWMQEEMIDPPSSYIRDWINIQDHYPVIKDSLDQTLESFSGDSTKKLSSMLLVLMRLMSTSNRPMKAILYGPSSRAYDHSYLILKQQNMYAASTSLESRGAYMAGNISNITDRISFAFNIFALSIKFGYSKSGEEFKTPMDVNSYINEEEMRSFFLDNTSSRATYKKILLMLLYHGRLRDVSSWSRKTRNIFHQWIKRSSVTDESGNKIYKGDFVLKSQLGDVVLQTDYNSFLNRITLTVNNNSDLSIVKELIDHSIEYSKMSAIDYWKKVYKGPYIMTSTMLVNSKTEEGFQMRVQSLNPVEYHPDVVKWESGFITLYDNSGDPIISTIEGLLHSDYCPETIDWDMLINGIHLKKLLPYRPFNMNFSVEHLSPGDVCDLIRVGDEASPEDLKVPMPKVSRITNIRLGTDYPEREVDSEFADIVIEMDEKNEPTQEYTMDELMDRYMAMDVTGVLDSLNFALIEEPTSQLDVWVDPGIDLNLLKTMTRQKITYQPKKILERIVNLKYQLLAKMLTNVNTINKKVIHKIKAQTNNEYLESALIYTYDHQYTNTETPSPYGYDIRINELFDRLYNI